MIKYFLSILSILALTSCEARNAEYYRIHPEQLEQVIKQCPAKQPADVSCEQLTSVAIDLNQLIDERKYNPLGFGQKIMALQTQLSDSKSNAQTRAAAEQELQQRLAVIRWLTSPTS